MHDPLQPANGCAWCAASSTTKRSACPKRRSSRARAGRTCPTRGPVLTAVRPRTTSRWSRSTEARLAVVIKRPGSVIVRTGPFVYLSAYQSHRRHAMKQFIPFEDDWDVLERLDASRLVPYQVDLPCERGAAQRT